MEANSVDLQGYIDEIKLSLTGDVLETELDDSTYARIIQASFREIQRYICSATLVTVPYSKCIDTSEYHMSSVLRVFRTEGMLANTQTGMADPIYMAQWQILSGNGANYNTDNWTYNYAAWNTALQIRNTASTDLSMRFDRDKQQLYINCAFDMPEKVTIEYIPRFNDVSEIKSDYWIDNLMRLATANAKIAVGRIRTRYTQSNPLWTQDGDKLLEEGNNEASAIREELKKNNQLVLGID